MGKADRATCSDSQHPIRSSKSCNVDVEQSGTIKISSQSNVECDVRHDEEQLSTPERKSDELKKAEVHRRVSTLRKENAFCFAMVLAVVVSTAVLGSSLVLLNLCQSKAFDNSLAGTENNANEVYHSKAKHGRVSPAKLRRRDGIDPQSSGEDLVERLYGEFEHDSTRRKGENRF